MGINLHAFNYLRKISKETEFKKTLTIGRQKISADKYLVNKIVNDNTINSKYIDQYLIKHFKSSSVDVLDVNDYEEANIIHNLNENIPENLEEKFDTIIDGGSLEHVFDIKTSLINLKKMCKPGGIIIHISPTNNFCGHGFYQFSPNLFHTFYGEDQGFKNTEIILCKVYDSYHWYKIKRENYNKNKRIDIITDEETFVFCSAIKDNLIKYDSVQQSDYSQEFYNNEKKLAQSNKNIVKINKFRIIKLKIANRFPLIKKIYNYFRKLREYRYNKLNKSNKNIEIINIKKIL
jgi:SAM-dependent methyltransferase